MAEKTDSQPDRTDLAFRYYEDQWTHVRHHESQQSSLTFQIVVLAVSLGGAYFSEQADSGPALLRVGLSVLIFLLGLIGLGLVISTHDATQKHILRARAARASLVVLEVFAGKVKSEDFPKIMRYFLALHFLIIVAGLLLLVMTFS